MVVDFLHKNIKPSPPATPGCQGPSREACHVGQGTAVNGGKEGNKELFA